MSPLSWIPVVVLIISIIAIVWLAFRAVLWAAVLGVLGLFVLAGLGWLWWWVPIVAAIVTLIGFLIGLLRVAIGRIVLTIVAILSVLLGVGSVGYANFGSPIAQATADLSVHPGDIIPAEAKCESDAFIPNSQPSTALLWGDSVSTPFTATDPNAMFAEWLDEDCGNPTVLMMNVEGLAATKITADLTIGDINPWMAKFIEQKQTGVVEGGFLTKKEGHGDEIFVTDDFQDVAELTNKLLLRLQVVGVVTEDSVTNWHVAAREGLAVESFPLATLNDRQEEGREVLRLEYSLKTGGCVIALGPNIGDKRFESLSCVTQVPPGTPGTPDTPPPSDCVENCDVVPPPPPTGDCRDNPDTPHHTWSEELQKWICKDDPSRDPEQQGNNRPGGGGVAPVQTDPVGPPAGGEPQPVYTPPPVVVETPAPQVTPVPIPSSSPVPTVAPTEQPPADGEVVGSGGCSAVELENGLCE